MLTGPAVSGFIGSTKYVVHHLYVAEKDDELTLDVGDVINVQDMSDPGWWVGEQVKNGKAGWFPSNVRRRKKEREPLLLLVSPAHWLNGCRSPPLVMPQQ